MQQTSPDRNLRAVLLIAAIVAVLSIVFYVFPPWQVATDSPDKARHAGVNQMPVALWWFGSLLLASALIYGIVRTRSRSRGQEQMTEDGTRQLYNEEAKDERRKAGG
jgi:hypothetical protein